MSLNQQIIGRDLAVLWHPCTQMKDHEDLPVIPIRRGEGVWLEDFDGNRYIDAISSWWVNLFGHANPRINAAVKDQLDTLEHVILAGFSHMPVVDLSERLVALTPPGLTRCFFSDNGSTAIEVALKMSYHYWRNTGQANKTRFINLDNSYHGETLGALAAGQVSLYKETYEPLLMDVITAPSPDCWKREPGESCEQYSLRMIEPMEALLERHAPQATTFIDVERGDVGHLNAGVGRRPADTLIGRAVNTAAKGTDVGNEWPTGFFRLRVEQTGGERGCPASAREVLQSLPQTRAGDI